MLVSRPPYKMKGTMNQEQIHKFYEDDLERQLKEKKKIERAEKRKDKKNE